MSTFSQHFVLTLGRSGSNTLVNMLNQHPGLLNYGEVLGEWNRIRQIQRRLKLFQDNDAAYLDALLGSPRVARMLNLYRTLSHRLRREPSPRKHFSGIQSLGVKEFSLNMDRYGLTSYLAERPHIQVIGLRRDDVIDRFISNAMLRQTGVVAARAGESTQRRKIRLDPAKLIDGLNSIVQENQFLDGMLSALPKERVHIIHYENLYTDPAHTMHVFADLISFLGLPPFQPKIKMRKIIHGPSVGRISNLDECRQAVQNTPFAHLFKAG